MCVSGIRYWVSIKKMSVLVLLFLISVSIQLRAETSDKDPHIRDPRATEHMRRAVAHFRDGAYRSALVELEVASRIDPDDAEILFHRSISLHKIGRNREARQGLSDALEAEPGLDGPLARFYLGMAYYDDSIFLTSKKEFDMVVNMSSGSLLADRAATYSSRIAKLFDEPVKPETLHWYFSRGLESFNRKDYREAIAYLGEVRELNQLRKARAEEELRKYRIAFILASSYNELGNHYEALDILLEAVCSDPPHLVQMGRAQLGLGKDEEAVESFKSAIDGNDPVWSSVARAYLEGISIDNSAENLKENTL